MSGIILSRIAVRELAHDPHLPQAVRILFLAAERVNDEGIAEFGEREMARALAFFDDVGGIRSDRAMRNALDAAARLGYVVGGSSVNSVRIDRAKVRAVA